jgi:hypothetical protein
MTTPAIPGSKFFYIPKREGGFIDLFDAYI